MGRYEVYAAGMEETSSVAGLHAGTVLWLVLEIWSVEVWAEFIWLSIGYEGRLL
jgi:hypothetical protein